MSVLHRIRSRVANWLLHGVQVDRLRVRHLKIGQNSIDLSPAGAGDVIRWSALKIPTQVRDIGMDATGRLVAYVSGAAERVPVESDLLRKRCRAATTANVANLAAGAPLTVDSITLVAGDRVFVAAQTDTSKLGIYTVDSAGTGSDGSWSRASDADVAADYPPGLEVYIEEGTSNGLTAYQHQTTGTITLDTTPLVFVQGRPLVRSDPSGVSVAFTVTGASNITTATNFLASSVDCRDYEYITFWIAVSAKAGASTLKLEVRWSEDNASFDQQKSESIASGIATLSGYEAQIDISGSTPAFVRHITIPTLGRRYALFGATVDAGTATATAKYQRGA